MNTYHDYIYAYHNQEHFADQDYYEGLTELTMDDQQDLPDIQIDDLEHPMVGYYGC
jgi:hypothetical protein